MFARERRDIIADMVNTRGQVRVKDLSGRFKVTEDCIRKDLALLEQEGRLSRAYGGAVKNRVNPHEFNVAQRLEKNPAARREIAAKALALIKEGDTVFLDISTANAELARLIAASSLKLTVVTNMAAVMQGLAVPCGAELVFIGGAFSPGRDGFIGAAAIAAIGTFRFDIAFMGVVGVDLYRNRVETYLADDGLTKQAALEASREKYMLLETRKFGAEAPFKYARIEDFTGIITEGPLPKDIAKALKGYTIKIL